MKSRTPTKFDYMKFEPPKRQATVLEQVEAAETRRADRVGAALAEVIGEGESAALMEDYAERTKREPRLSEYELSLLERAD